LLEIIGNRNIIQKIEKMLVHRLEDFSDRKGSILIGGPGWHNTREAHWSNKLGIWWASYKLENRNENAFGIGEPRWNSRYNHTVSCVIDIPIEDINRRIGGAFATNDEGIFLVHRGKIGGGRKAIGKSLFLQNYRGNLVAAQDGKAKSLVALVGEIKGERFPYQLSDFVNELQRIKECRTSALEFQVQPFEETVKEEFTGKREYNLGHITAECDHGFIVNGLAEILRKKGFKVANRRPIDLFTYEKNEKSTISSLFEIKTESETTDCYTAIGQLLVYSSGMEDPSLFAVFPETLSERFRRIIEDIGIIVILYKWENKKPVFRDFKI
jgi:hypothetical protein